MDSTIIRAPRPQIFRKPGKRVPLEVADVLMLEAWRAEMREVVTALQEATLDATARDRVHSRRELRRRLGKLMKRLSGLVDSVRPSQSPEPPSASELQMDKLRLVSVP
jgi:hypothetical protein